jgi:mannose-1-phosphate guanylyltransferase
MKASVESNSNNYLLIMAGGVGSRFWPKSRNSFPKQFIDILGTGKSLLQYTFDRFLNLVPSENIYVLTNADYKALVINQLPKLPIENILLEPSRNNTAPCLAYASYKILKKNTEATIVVAPSDHLILKEEQFLENVRKAFIFASKNDSIITLGISPTRPDTGYGYINYNKEEILIDGAYPVNAFLEKPPLEKAKEYLDKGDYLWNAGIFIWSAQSIKKAFINFAPEIHSIFEKGIEFYNTNKEQGFINEFYPKSPNISIDYAILEKADNVYTIPSDIGWSDLGTWASLHEVLAKDDSGNSINSNFAILENTSHSLINVPSKKAVVIKGLQDYIVVDDENILLIYPKSEEQSIKKISGDVVSRFGTQYE